MISSAKMHKFTAQLQRLLPYRNMVQSVIGHLLATDVEYSSPLINVREVKKVALVAFGSDDGLCGAFNIYVGKFLLETVRAPSASESAFANRLEGNRLDDSNRSRSARAYHWRPSDW